MDDSKIMNLHEKLQNQRKITNQEFTWKISKLGEKSHASENNSTTWKIAKITTFS